VLKGVAPNQLTANDFVAPSQSELVSNNALLAQFAAAGFHDSSMNTNGPLNTPLLALESSTTVPVELASSNTHSHT
jgi:hypothetical protein